MKLTDKQKATIGTLVANALAGGGGNGGHADNIVGATIIAMESLQLCGQHWVDEVFAKIDDTVVVDWYIGDGQSAETNDVICKLIGPATALQAGETIALNFLRTLSSKSTTTSNNTDAADISMILKID